jgi:hypothetical protein
MKCVNERLGWKRFRRFLACTVQAAPLGQPVGGAEILLQKQNVTVPWLLGLTRIGT